jgi:hypothetical protein
VLSAAIPAIACEQTSGEVSLGKSQIKSRLTEMSSNGKVLVSEQGSLPGAEANAFARCDKWIVGIKSFSNDGARGYSGQTSLGVPLVTSSGVSDSATSASLYWLLTESLQFGVDVSQHQSIRNIVGTASAAGYPETYKLRLARIGTKWDLPTNYGRWSLAGSISAMGDQSVDLTLPGKDTTPLNFNQPKQWELGVHWRMNLGSNFYVEASYRYVNTETSQSKDGVVTSSGVPVGIAFQPKMIVVNQPLSVLIGVAF